MVVGLSPLLVRRCGQTQRSDAWFSQFRRQSCSVTTSVTSPLQASLNVVRYIKFTFYLAYLFTSMIYDPNDFEHLQEL